MSLEPGQMAFLLDQASRSKMTDRHMWNQFTEMALPMARSFTAEQVCVVVHACARVAFKKHSLLTKLCQQAISKQHSLTPRQISGLLSDLGKLQFLDDSTLMAFTETIRRSVHLYNVFELALVVTAYGRIDLRDHLALDLLADTMGQKVTEGGIGIGGPRVVDPSMISAVVFALLKLDYGHWLLGVLLFREIPKHIAHLPLQSLVNCTFALMSLDVLDPPLACDERGVLPADDGERTDVSVSLFLRLMKEIVKRQSELVLPEIRQLHIIDACIQYCATALGAAIGERGLPAEVSKLLCDVKGVGLGNSPTPSTMQVRVERLLDDLQVRYKKEMPIYPYVVDFAVPDEMVVLEVDGFTHFYVLSRRFTLKSRLRRRILEAAGWKVVSLPYFEWKNKNQVDKRDFLTAAVQRDTNMSLKDLR